MNELALANQLCFPLYAASKEIIKRYKTLLDPLDLTYTQYLVMLVLWESEPGLTDAHKLLSVKDLGDALCLDSGTLTPLLKKLEQKNYLLRGRDSKDERQLNLKLTEKGLALREEAKAIPKQVRSFFPLETSELGELQALLNKLLNNLQTVR